MVMSEQSLEEVKQFHIELLGIATAGISVQLEMGETSKTFGSTLDQILASLESEVQKNHSLESAIESQTSLSTEYKSALKTWLLCDRSPMALESLTTSPIGQKKYRRLLELSMVQPVILIVLAYFSLIYICLMTIPKFESIYEQIRETPGIALSIMSSVRRGMPIWIPAVPLLFLWGIVSLYRRVKVQSRQSSVLRDRVDEQLRNANDSYRLAVLLDNNVTLEKALEVVSIIPTTMASTTSKKSSDHPLMQWGLSQLTTESANPSLEFVARTYRQIADVRVQFARRWLPTISLGVIGGFLVLGVGLSVFFPLAELLMNITKGK